MVSGQWSVEKTGLTGPVLLTTGHWLLLLSAEYADQSYQHQVKRNNVVEQARDN